jgi:ACS family D-galactonate transporter-like MFS transporter
MSPSAMWSPGTGSSTLSNRRRWAVVGLLFAASMINYLDRASLSLALPTISADLHLDATRKGLLLSAFFWSYALMQVPVGLAVDRFPIRWMYAGMFAVWSLACGFTGLAGSLAVFVALRIVLGFGESVYFPGGTKTVSLLFAPKDRGLPSGLFDSGTRVGLVVGGLLIPWLIISFGWRVMFMVLGFASLVWLLPWLLVVPARLTPAPPARPADTPTRPGFRLPTFNRNLLGICLGFFCFDYFVYLLLTWLPDYLVQVRHLTLMKAGFYSAMPYLVFGSCQAFGGWLGDSLIGRGWSETRTRKGIVTVGFLSGLLLIPAVQVQDANTAIALIIGASFVGLAVGNLTAIVQNCAPADEVGVWTGMENFIGNLAGVLAPLATGILISRTGSYMPGFSVAALILVAGLVPYWWIVGELKPPEPADRDRLPAATAKTAA